MGKKIVKYIANAPLVRLSDATFFREDPNLVNRGSNPPLFPGTNFEISSRKPKREYWAVTGPAGSGKTTFLEILKGSHFSVPSPARSNPYLAHVTEVDRIFDARSLRNRDVSKAIRYAGFGGKGTKSSGLETRGSYMAARYESHHEAEDFSLKDYLLGMKEPNPVDDQNTLTAKKLNEIRLNRVATGLHLDHLLDLPALVLSNGQTRRATIAKAFMEVPLLLLLDEPFLGIDPIHHRILSPALWSLSRRSGPNLLISLGNNVAPPRWITHLICLDQCRIQFSGPKDVVYDKALAAGYPLSTARLKRTLWKGASNTDFDEGEMKNQETDLGKIDKKISMTDIESKNAIQPAGQPEDSDLSHQADVNSCEIDSSRGDLLDRRRPRFSNRWDIQYDLTETLEIGEPVIEMRGVEVSYGPMMVLGDWHQPEQNKPGLYWTLKRGERWGIFGSNGSGKTTLLSLVNSDHPKSYSQSITYFGKSRLPEPGQPGISIFDLQSKIMLASPEVHAFFPKHLSIRAVLENAWADTFLSKPRLTHKIDSIVEASLRWFEKELNPNCTEIDPITTLAAWYHKYMRRGKNRVASYQERRLDWADTLKLSEISFAAQRVALFLRAMIKKPDIVILDEAFSGMDKDTRAKCMMFLAYGETRTVGLVRYYQDKEIHDFDKLVKSKTPLEESGLIKVGPFESRQALVAIAHEEEEIPPLVDQYLFLEESGTKKPPRFGEIPRLDRYRIGQRVSWWKKMWHTSVQATNKEKNDRSYH